MLVKKRLFVLPNRWLWKSQPALHCDLEALSTIRQGLAFVSGSKVLFYTRLRRSHFLLVSNMKVLVKTELQVNWLTYESVLLQIESSQQLVDWQGGQVPSIDAACFQVLFPPVLIVLCRIVIMQVSLHSDVPCRCSDSRKLGGLRRSSSERTLWICWACHTLRNSIADG